jgi:hypothetical protein
MTVEALGIDTATNALQLHGVNRGGRVMLKCGVMRDQLLEVLAQIEPCTAVVEPVRDLSVGHGNSRHSAIRSRSTVRKMPQATLAAGSSEQCNIRHALRL